MTVSPRNAGTIMLQGTSGDIQEPDYYPSSVITCFHINEMITITAKGAGGYQFQQWDFNYWPLDRDERTDKTSNPLSFKNTFLLNDGYGESYNDVRTITAYFVADASPPQTPKNILATDGTETDKVIITWDAAAGASSYAVYWADSRQGEKTWLANTSTTTYTDTRIYGDTVYYYSVKAENQYGESQYSIPDTGYAYVDVPPPPRYEPTDITPEEAKKMLDENPAVIVVDVSMPADFNATHILCAENADWQGIFDTMDYPRFQGLEDFPIIVYDQDEANSNKAAVLMAEKGFSAVHHMTGGLDAWIKSGYETVNDEFICECFMPPMALAGPDTMAAENIEIQLDGSGSKAADDSALTYQWFYVGDKNVVFENPAVSTPVVTTPYVIPGEETIVAYLTVTDGKGNQDTDSVKIQVLWENSEPIADAGEFQTIPEKATVILDGAASWDRDDGIASWAWKQISGPTVSINDANAKIAWFSAPDDIDSLQTELIFELTVTDKGGLAATDRVTVLVIRNNTPPIADAGPEQVVLETQPVQLDGSGSKDPDNDDLEYAWTQVGGSTNVRLSSPTEKQPTFAAPEVISGNIPLEFRLTVTDSSGAQSVDTVTVTVNDAGYPPTADAGTDFNPAYEGWTITLDGSDSVDMDGSIQSYQWIQISGPEVVLENASSFSPWFIVPVITDETAQLVFELTVVDDTGLYGSDEVKAVVRKAENGPTAEAGIEIEVKKGKKVVLDGSGSNDPDDGIAHYSWKQTQGEPVTLSDASAMQPEFTAPDQIKNETILSFNLTVTDYSGKSDTDEVQVLVRPGGSGSSGCFISSSH